jgi:hypothetical protein
MDTFLQKAFRANREIRGHEGTEAFYANTEQGLTAFLNNYISGGHMIVVAATTHQHIEVDILKHRRNRSICRSRDERKIVISKLALRDYLHKNDIQSADLALDTFAKETAYAGCRHPMPRRKKRASKFREQR